MKKTVIVTLLGVVVLGAALFAGLKATYSPKDELQGAVSPLKPGIYKVEYDKPDFRGWKAFFVMEVDSAGEITKATFDYITNAGQLKTQNAQYNRTMKNKTGVGPLEYCPRFAKNLVTYQDPAQIDGITGATHSSHDFKQFAQAAFNAAKAGNQMPILLPQPEAVDPNAGGQA